MMDGYVISPVSVTAFIVSALTGIDKKFESVGDIVRIFVTKTFDQGGNFNH